MDTIAKEINGYMNKPVASLDAQKIEDHGSGEEDDDSDSKSLLLPRNGDMMSRKSDEIRRKVQWNDKNGNNLTEVLEFMPSDVSDSEDEDSESCVCTIM